jgi:hypothetical protein
MLTPQNKNSGQSALEIENGVQSRFIDTVVKEPVPAFYDI